jgi:hypothetical protein
MSADDRPLSTVTKIVLCVIAVISIGLLVLDFTRGSGWLRPLGAAGDAGIWLVASLQVIRMDRDNGRP